MTSPPLRSVLVDDAADFRSLLGSLLDREPDLEVAGEAADGEAGLVAVGELRPDVVVTDLHMPGMDGLELTRHLLASDPGLPVVMVTGNPLPDLERLAAEAGVTCVLSKTAVPAQLVPALREATGSSPAGVAT